MIGQSTPATGPAKSRGGARLDDRVALVLGASRGIGAQIACTLADRGAMVVAAARTERDLHAVAQQITNNGGHCLVVVTDASKPSSINLLMERTFDAYERLDIAVNNAATNHPPKPLAEVSLEEFDTVIDLNLRGLFVALQVEICAMLRSGGGSIINIGSTAGLRAVPRLAAYTTTKHALVGLTKVAALDHAADGIRVNAIAPGPISTDRLTELPEDVRRRIADTVPMSRVGTTQEVADLAGWLACDEASFVTGTVLTVDGGRLAGGA